MNKFAPTPWIPKKHGMDWVVQAADGRMFIIGDAVYHDENEGNARLISLAPDMLKAIEFYLYVLDTTCGTVAAQMSQDLQVRSIFRTLAKTANGDYK